MALEIWIVLARIAIAGGIGSILGVLAILIYDWYRRPRPLPVPLVRDVADVERLDFCPYTEGHLLWVAWHCVNKRSKV